MRSALARAEGQLALKPGESQADYQSRREQVLQEVHQQAGREPWWVEYSKSFFPVILVVFLLRSFLVEPFKIPSGSMIPTLLVGDFILVNKFTYGIRLPVMNQKVLEVNEPQRGEVMVFRYPENPSLDYIKRVVGLPGDVRDLSRQAADHQRPAGADRAADGLRVQRRADSTMRLGQAIPGSTRRAPARHPDQPGGAAGAAGRRAPVSRSARTVNTMTRASSARSRRDTTS